MVQLDLELDKIELDKWVSVQIWQKTKKSIKSTKLFIDGKLISHTLINTTKLK